MRTLTAAQEFRYALTNRKVAVRVKVEDGDGTLQDLTDFYDRDWVDSVEYGDDVDSDGPTATIKLRREAYNDSLAPWQQASRLNLNSLGSYDQLLDLRREVVVEVAILAQDSLPVSGDWEEVFRGQIDQIDWESDPVTLTCRDQVALLQDTFIETEAAYSDADGETLESIMQLILNDALGGSAPTLYVPSSPSWMITEFASQIQSVLDQLTLLTDQIGWTVKYIWDSGTSAFRLTLFEYDRTKATVDRTFGPSEYYDVTTLSLSLSDIRNVVAVTYSDPADLDSSGQPTRKTQTATDATSITRYGRRYMAISEASTSNIDTAAEALALAEACLADLKDPLATHSVQLPYAHYVELGDRYTFDANNVHYSTSQTMSVIAWSHTLSSTAGAKTTITCRCDAPSSGRTKWFGMAAIRGIAPLVDKLGPTSMPNGNTPAIIEAATSLIVQTPQAKEKYVSWEIHIGASGFTPDETSGSGTYAGRADGNLFALLADESLLPVDTLRDVVAIPIDRSGNRGTSLRVTNKKAKRLGSHHLDPTVRVGGTFLGSTFSKQSRGTSYPPDFWNMRVGTWSTDADVDSGAIYSAPKTGAKGLTLKNTVGATTLYSDYTAVTAGRRYSFEMEWKANSTLSNNLVTVEWLAADASTIVATTTLMNRPAAVSGTFETLYASVAPPSGAAWARLTVGKAAAAYYLHIDRMVWEEDTNALADKVLNIELFDDFVTSNSLGYGELGWTKYSQGADPLNNGALTVSKPSTGSTTPTWADRGIIKLTTPAVSGYGGAVVLGDSSSSPFTDAPPTGVECRIKAALPGTATNILGWLGLWSDETTYPDGSLVNSIKGIGFRVNAAGASANWFGVCRDGTTETQVDLGVAAGMTFKELGWRRTVSGVQFMVNGQDVGSEITTNIPSGSPKLFPTIGVITTSAAAKDLQVDYFGLGGRAARY